MSRRVPLAAVLALAFLCHTVCTLRTDRSDLGSAQDPDPTAAADESLPAAATELPYVCASSCKIGNCTGPQSYKCTACPNGRVLMPMTTDNGTLADYGQCIVCPVSCKPGSCVGRRGDQCTECWKGAVLAKNKDKDYGQCVQCANNCRFEKCVGPRPDQCTECNHPKTLVENEHPDAYTKSTVASGTCTGCASSCQESKCVGPRSDECTACDGDRSMVFVPSPTGNGTANYGQCVRCASNCRPGKCAGPTSYHCLACNDNQVLVKEKDGPHAGKAYGSCMNCAYTCAPLKCMGQEPYECTECGPGRSLVPAAEGKTNGYCAANSVLANTALRKELAEQAAEIKMLKERDATAADSNMLGDVRDGAGGLSEMGRATVQISKQMADVDKMAQALTK